MSTYFYIHATPWKDCHCPQHLLEKTPSECCWRTSQTWCTNPVWIQWLCDVKRVWFILLLHQCILQAHYTQWQGLSMFLYNHVLPPLPYVVQITFAHFISKCWFTFVAFVCACVCSSAAFSAPQLLEQNGRLGKQIFVAIYERFVWASLWRKTKKQISNSHTKTPRETQSNTITQMCQLAKKPQLTNTKDISSPLAAAVHINNSRLLSCLYSKSLPTMTGASIRDRDLDLAGE